jgi:hypothetical protein
MRMVPYWPVDKVVEEGEDVTVVRWLYFRAGSMDYGRLYGVTFVLGRLRFYVTWKR